MYQLNKQGNIFVRNQYLSSLVVKCIWNAIYALAEDYPIKVLLKVYLYFMWQIKCNINTISEES